MGATNSYFRIIQGDKGIDMQVFPPEESGVRLTIDSVKNYLSKMLIEGYDLKAVNDAITTATQPVIVHLTDSEGSIINEYMEVIVSPDKMYAICKFYPASNEGSAMNFEDVMDELKRCGVKFGILEDEIKKYIANPCYCTGVVLAKGQKAEEGKDAIIEYEFQTDRAAKPHLNDDGTVNFHELDNINHVHAGDILARLTKEVPGKAGCDVYGNAVAPRNVNRLILKFGKNISLSEDGLKITSDVDGHVTLEGDRVFVSNVYRVPADVDASTGDLAYNGSIEVNGNVRTGFKIIADGNIEIKGVVEGAHIEAKGDIILHRGVQGMSRAVLKAGGNVVSKFIESAHVEANGYIETDTILHSTVSAKGDVCVRGRNGSIIGGNVRAISLIEASIVGSTMGTMTVLEVGCDPSIQDKAFKCKKVIAEKSAEQEKLAQVVMLLKKKKLAGELPVSKQGMLISAINGMTALEKELKVLREEYETYKTLLDENKNARIKINREVYPGAKMVISGDFILVHEALSHCQYIKQKGEIIATPI